MADNITINEGTGKAIAADDVSSVWYQKIKLDLGGDGVAVPAAADIGIKANALRIAPASDITDGTYIGDINFGESLPAGTNAIGKLAANSGVDIGDVDITSIAAGTNLIGKMGIDQVTANANEVVTKTGSVTKLEANSGVDIGDVDVISSALPTGAATAANQLADGHNVTVDNTSGASAVNIQDGGNSITVDNGGTFATQATLQAGTAEIGKLAAGTASIGTLGANSGVDIGDVDVTSQPARDNATDTITVSLDTAAIMNDTTAITPQFAVINAATSGNNTLIAAVTAKKIRVLSLTLVMGAATTVRFESGASGTALTGQMELAANSGLVLPFNPVGHFETASNTLLNLELSAANNADGFITYIEI